MKIASKILLIVLLLLGLSLPLAYRAYAMAQISLQNNTKLWLNLYIDGNFGCGPVMPSGFCTSSVTAGSHLLEARKGAEVVSSESGVNIGDGTSPTWTVTIEEAPTLEGKWMIRSATIPSLIGKYWTFTRNGDSYTLSTGMGWWPCPPGDTFYGGPTVFTSSFTPDYACLLRMYPGKNYLFNQGLQGLAGKTTHNERITLSPDGNSITFAIDSVNFFFMPNGKFSRLEVNPLADITTLVRVSLR
jgi:hypothetical protein